MPRRLAAFLMAALALAGSALAGAAEMRERRRPARSTELPRPLDGDVAVRQELDVARRAGTVAAYDLFLRRQGNHPLAETARRERAVIAAQPQGH